MRLLILVAGREYWGLQVMSSFSIFNLGLRFKGMFWERYILKDIEDFNLEHWPGGEVTWVLKVSHLAYFSWNKEPCNEQMIATKSRSRVQQLSSWFSDRFNIKRGIQQKQKLQQKQFVDWRSKELDWNKQISLGQSMPGSLLAFWPVTSSYKFATSSVTGNCTSTVVSEIVI